MAKITFEKRETIEDRIDLARGLKAPEVVLKGAQWLDVFSGRWLEGDIAVDQGVIVGVGEKYQGVRNISLNGRYLVPGFIDSHLHIESTLMTPGEFEKAVLPRGTTSAIVDPHEIVNVMGRRGLDYILECASKSKMDIHVMLSSCVPATHLETSGAKVSASDLLPYKDHPHVLGLAEMMNYPGVLNKDSDVIEKIFQFQDMPIDGHSPLLRGKDLNAYLVCGIKTCHESVSVDEAQEKLERGMQVLLREGSVAKNLEELCSILTEFSSPHVSLCTDDRNPADILDEGHIDYLIRTAIKKGVPPQAAYRAASFSTARCYGLKNKGALAPGYVADIVALKDYRKCIVDKVFKKGVVVDLKSLNEKPVDAPSENTIRCVLPSVEQLQVSNEGRSSFRVIGIIPNSIITENLKEKLVVEEGLVQRDLKRDILKIAVLERYGHDSPPSVGFVKGMGLKDGAIGSSVGHDSHNMVTIGANDEDMLVAFSRMKELGGGFVVVKGGRVMAELALPVAGLMTTAPLKDIYQSLGKIKTAAKNLGCRLSDPFLQMAFLCLPVIPKLKITDKGLVDVEKFQFVPVTLF